MLEVLISTALSFSITFFTIPIIIFLAKYLRIYDLPNERKVHVTPVPSLGGLAIFAGLILTSLVMVPFNKAPEFQYVIAACIIIFFLGLKDDLLATAPMKKFILQSFAAALIIYKGDVQIDNMYGFLGIYQMTPFYSFLLTYFTVIVIINSINLIDGIDGLAGSLGLISTFVMGAYFMRVGEVAYAVMSLALCGSLSAFLIFNFSPAKIFMGDTGSYLVGLICAVLLVKFINVSVGNSTFPISSSPAIAFSILVIPLLDTLRVFGIRILQRRSPFSPDKNHIHHLLLKRGLTHQQITGVLVGLNAGFILLTYLLRDIGITWCLLTVIGMFFSGIAILNYFNERHPVLLEKKAAGPQKILHIKQGPAKVVALTNEHELDENIVN
jgi:UDP-N-acetylmuramyl pentapeptide phosphotransferase/UDP-N-acetylglucosamine-1-phosphate transferase